MRRWGQSSHGTIYLDYSYSIFGACDQLVEDLPDRLVNRNNGLARRAGRGEACTRDGDPAEPAHLSGGCPGHRRCQATVLVAIVAAILVAVLVTILANIVVAVAAVTVTFAVP